MPLYVETSAVLAWLFGEPEGGRAVEKMDGAELVVSSALTILETERSLVRAVRARTLTEADANRIRRLFRTQHLSWEMIEITPEVRDRAGQPFPVEPVRSLDAIHLATALRFLELHDDLAVLTFDERVAANLEPLGLHSA